MSTNQETSDSENFLEPSIIVIKKKSFKLNHGDLFCEMKSLRRESREAWDARLIMDIPRCD